MHWTDMAWLSAGLVAQAFFAARFLSQWLLSERAGKSLMPVHFWYLSVAGSVLLLAYAVHRRDPVIASGQLVGLAVYMRNLRFIDSVWLGRHSATAWVGLAVAAAGAGYALGPSSATKPLLLRDFWTVFGFVGQALFTGRFVLQWWYTERARRSVVPRYFWYLSIGGTLMLFTYAVAVVDPVIMLGQALALIVYSRNLVLLNRCSSNHTVTGST